MRGYVLVFRPASGTGTVVTEAGQMLPFAADPTAVDLHGGDSVCFRRADSGPNRLDANGASAVDIELLQAGVELLGVTQAPLLRELSRTVEMEPVH